MFKRGGKKTIFGKIFFSLPALLVLIFLAGSAACLLAITVISGDSAKQYVTTLNQKEAMAAQDEVVKNEVASVVSMLNVLQQKVDKGELTKAKAKKLGADLLRDMRYGKNNEGYFFADTLEGVNVVLLGDKSTEGRNRLQDNSNGVYYVKALLEAGQKDGGGFSNYWFPKKDGAVAKEKRAYSLVFEPFGWVVGTGYYLEDLK